MHRKLRWLSCLGFFQVSSAINILSYLLWIFLSYDYYQIWLKRTQMNYSQFGVCICFSTQESIFKNACFSTQESVFFLIMHVLFIYLIFYNDNALQNLIHRNDSKQSQLCRPLFMIIRKSFFFFFYYYFFFLIIFIFWYTYIYIYVNNRPRLLLLEPDWK